MVDRAEYRRWEATLDTPDVLGPPAVVAAAEAIEQIEPGDVLVTGWTSPSFNAVMSIAGAVVVQEGGLLCHAAVMTRELGLPAVIGCRNAMATIRTGCTVEVDPGAGTVRTVEGTVESGLKKTVET